MFSDEDVEEGWKSWRGDPVASARDANPINTAMRRVMTRAVEIAAARGGTTPEPVRMFVEGFRNLRFSDTELAAVAAFIKTLGARVAVLEAENATYGKAVDSLTRVVEKDQQHISDLEKSLENVRKERDEAIPRTRDAERRADLSEQALREAQAANGRLLSDSRHIAQQRDTALSDNAALLMFVAPLAEVACEGVGPEECGECVSCMAKLHVAQPHPGAALLEEHRKALERRDAAMKLAAMTQQTVEMLNARIDQDEIDHAKALVRARNEGLEEALQEVATVASKPFPDSEAKMLLDYAQDRIRAMKELEPH